LPHTVHIKNRGVSKMKKILVLLVLGALGYFIYSKYLPGGNSVSTEGYSFKAVAEKPIPRDAFLPCGPRRH
jgi:hypothetical protein